MKTWIKVAFFALFSSLAKADTPVSIGGPWGGLNDGDAAVTIGDRESQSLLNVDITKGQNGINKRDGTTQFKTVGTSTWGVRGGYYFRTITGADLIINANNQSVYKSQASAAYTAFVTTATAGSYFDFVDSNGYLWAADNNNDEIWKYDGTTRTYYPTHPKGNQVEVLPDRLVISGTAANPNRINLSAAADFSNFTVGGVLDTDPFYEDVGLPGQSVSAIKYAFGRILIWTKTSLSFWSGTSQFDGSIEDITTTIGTNQPSSIVYDLNKIFWQGQDGHFYSYDGSTIDWISRKIGGSVSGFVNSGDNKTWVQTTQSDFNTGTIDVGLSTTFSSGDVLFSSVTIDDFSDGDYSLNPVWTVFDNVNSTVNVVSSRLKINPNSTGASELNYTYNKSTGSWRFTFQKTSSATGKGRIGMQLSKTTPIGESNNWMTVCGAKGYVIFVNDATSPNQLTLSRCDTVGSGPTILLSSNTTLSYDVDHTVILDRSSTSVFNIYYDSIYKGSATDVTYTSMTSISIGISATVAGYQATYYFDDIGFDSFLSTFTSQSFNIGTNITSFGQFALNNVLSNATIGYSFYGCATSVCSTTTFTSSQTITSGSVPTIATAPYIAWSSLFERNSSTKTASLSDVTIAWNEGTITRNWGSVDKDHRIIWSVAEGTATVPNVSYIYDQRFDSWLKYSIPFDAPARVGSTLYFGGVSTGVVYNYPFGNSDSGNAINAFWKSKDFIGDDPFNEKKFNTFSVIAKKNTGSPLYIDWTSDNYITGTLGRTQSTRNNQNYGINNMFLPSGTKGTFINFKLYNNAADSPFEFYSLRYSYDSLPWRSRFNN